MCKTLGSGFRIWIQTQSDPDPEPVGSGTRSSRIRNEIQSDPDLFFTGYANYASSIFPVFYSTYCEDQNLTFDYGKLSDLDLTVSKGGLRTELVSFQKQDPDRQPSYGQSKATMYDKR